MQVFPVVALAELYDLELFRIVLMEEGDRYSHQPEPIRGDVLGSVDVDPVQVVVIWILSFVVGICLDEREVFMSLLEIEGCQPQGIVR